MTPIPIVIPVGGGFGVPECGPPLGNVPLSLVCWIGYGLLWVLGWMIVIAVGSFTVFLVLELIRYGYERATATQKEQ